MHTHKFLIAIACASIVQANSTPAVAQTNSSTERQKAHVVSRMYQATYGAQERCRPLKDASANLSKAIDQLRRAYPDLMNLIDNSPHLPQAKEQFKKFLTSSASQTDEKELLQECSGLEYMLRQFVEDTGGQQAANDMIQTLKK